MSIHTAEVNSELILSSLMEHLPHKIFCKDRESVYISCNEKYAADLGISPEEIGGHTDFDFHPAELAEKYRRDDQEILSSGRSRTIEETYVQDGKELCVRTIKAPLKDESGKIIGVFGIFADITEEYRQKALIHTLMNSTTDQIYSKNMDSKFTWANQSLAEKYGLARGEDLIGKSDFNYFSEGHAAKTFAEEQEILRSGRQFEAVEEKEIWPDGRVTWVNSTKVPIRDEKDKVIGLAGISRDITQMKEVEAALEASEERGRKSEEMLNFAINQMPVPVIIAEAPDVKISYMNSAAYRMLTKPVEDAATIALQDHREFWPTFYPDGTPYEVADLPLTQAIAGGKITRGREILIRGEKDIWVKASSAPLKDEEGKVIAGIVVFPDITGLKDVELKLTQAVEKLERSNHELEQFAYAISHDLQEPLRKVKNFTDLFSKRFSSRIDEKADTYISYITDGASRMHRMIEDLLAYSRVNSREINPERLDMNRVVAEVLELLSLRMEESNAQIEVENLPVCLADKPQMVRLIQNLIENAIKFRGDQVPMLHISATDRKDHFLFRIKDNGIGIDPKFSDRIFLVFQRLHTREEYPGTGIGLALCRKIMDRHQGTIWFEPAPEGGSEFLFTLPK